MANGNKVPRGLEEDLISEKESVQPRRESEFKSKKDSKEQMPKIP